MTSFPSVESFLNKKCVALRRPSRRLRYSFLVIEANAQQIGPKQMSEYEQKEQRRGHDRCGGPGPHSSKLDQVRPNSSNFLLEWTPKPARWELHRFAPLCTSLHYFAVILLSPFAAGQQEISKGFKAIQRISNQELPQV